MGVRVKLEMASFRVSRMLASVQESKTIVEILAIERATIPGSDPEIRNCWA
jgi:hypothetical protein